MSNDLICKLRDGRRDSEWIVVGVRQVVDGERLFGVMVEDLRVVRSLDAVLELYQHGGQCCCGLVGERGQFDFQHDGLPDARWNGGWSFPGHGSGLQVSGCARRA